MPQMSTSSPACTRARVTTMRHAVRVASVNAAATSHGIDGGTMRTLTAGTTRYSAIVPGRCSPSILYRTHSDCSPFTQYSHVRSEMPPLMMTRSPRRIPRTADPDVVDDAGAIGPHDPGRRDHDAGKAFDHEEIEMIERGRADPNAHVIRAAKLRLGDVGTILELLQPAVGGDRQRSHVKDSGLYSQNPMPACGGEQTDATTRDHSLT